jgi:UDP-2,4-diacetamido-2,4,6-trideoxy-beta-L-altropyranose hydrolase
MKPVLTIRADADAKIGVGHVMRCLALAQEWRARGGDATFICASIPEAVQTRLREEGFRSIRIPAMSGSDEDALQTSRELSQCGAHLLVVDGVQFRHHWQKLIKQTRVSVLLLEDNGTSPPYCADWVWNADLPVRPEMYQKCEPPAKLLLGPQYVLLRREFLKAEPRSKATGPVRNVLITMGGSDPENFSERTVTALRPVCRDCKLRIVVGAANSHVEKLRVAVRDIGAELLRATDNMAEHMAWADLAFTVEGGTLWELLYMGVPVICWSRSEPVSMLLSELRSRGMVTALGSNTEPDVLAGIFQDLTRDNIRLNVIRENSRTMVDGRGAERVAHALLTGISG